MQGRSLPKPNGNVYPLTGRRIGRRLAGLAALVMFLGVYDSVGGSSFPRTLAHVGLSMFAGAGIVYVALFPVTGDPVRHRGIVRFTLEELERMKMPLPDTDLLSRHFEAGGCDAGDHLLMTTYRRPLRRAFRKQMTLRCWECDLQVREPQ